ncbi:copper homeostasis protein CutC [Lactococcus carnosus]|uniref:copper homeostasis protein CutC n=1 Tax=Pseudolactococcus carnosus TaxID=2749961 RepID=UPI000811D9E6|nr:copper homeostasis protein CutC [Lactococcus carnosus]SCA92688.1 putative copper homeostasis protein, CutC-like protein [Lactococcus piscium]MCJ1969668.1 copper homeostasis protein CutC [Lactococcus carnosus]MCJ1973298.1 copper homeostasis protein CutC [Lactococcus carnosus]MCJ1975273.1 copper homeostasis protein CutC [Lactococcus carnosus]MCJ1978946.1 copper homeostasis protein CutC [Lactococcus carnosus]
MLIREFCAENFTDIPRVTAAGVERIELCDNLAQGGTTPSYGVIKETADYLSERKTTFATMIRPRGGDFVYHSIEVRIMETDILKALEAGTNELVFGALTPENELDIDVLETLMIASQGLPVTFHMAFDAIPYDQQKAALDTLVELGFDKILMHGDSLDKSVNTDHIAELVKYASGRIQILTGGGVSAETAQAIADLTGSQYVHGTKIITC